MSITKTNAMRLLDKAKIEYNVNTYDTEDGKIDGVSVATKVNKPCNIVFKTLVTKGLKNYYVFVLPVDKELNLKSCAKAVNEKSVELIKTTDLLKVTGYIRGGCSPLGMKKPYTTVFDNSIEDLENIVFSGGKIGCQIEMSPTDLKAVIDYITYNITEE